MKRAILLILLLSLAALLAGCGTFLKAVPVDKSTGKFPTEKTLQDSEILVKKQLNLSQYKQLAFVQDGEFTKDMVTNIGYFDNVVTKTEFEKILLEKKLADKVPSVSDLMGLHQAQKAYGDFLVIKIDVIRKEGKKRVELSAMDPESGSTLFHAFRPGQVGPEYFDQNITYPLFNGLIDWINENK
jgi:hypothetical protein